MCIFIYNSKKCNKHEKRKSFNNKVYLINQFKAIRCFIVTTILMYVYNMCVNFKN